jgi:hypothetical protein
VEKLDEMSGVNVEGAGGREGGGEEAQHGGGVDGGSSSAVKKVVVRVRAVSVGYIYGSNSSRGSMSGQE